MWVEFPCISLSRMWLAMDGFPSTHHRHPDKDITEGVPIPTSITFDRQLWGIPLISHLQARQLIRKGTYCALLYVRVKPHLALSIHNISKIEALVELQQDNRQVAYFSKKLDATQHNYLVYDKKLLVVISTLKNWKHFLYGWEFVVKTEIARPSSGADHAQRQLEWSTTLMEPNIPAIRWHDWVTPWKAQPFGRHSWLVQPTTVCSFGQHEGWVSWLPKVWHLV